MIKILIILFLVSCGNEPAKKPDKKEPLLDKAQIEFLQAKFDLYKQLSEGRLDDAGWILDTKCDATLFQSLYSIATGLSDPLLSQDPDRPGKFYRHHSRSCYENHKNDLPEGSSSETSRDMYIGLFSYLLHTDKKEVFQAIVEFGENNNWVMGAADNIGAVEFRPDTIAHTYAIEHYFRLGNNINKGLPLSYAKCKDFACHLRALLIWQRFEMGLYNKRDQDQLTVLAGIDERNSLFNAMIAKFNNSRAHAQLAFEWLSNETLFPDGDLPTTKNKCGFYLWEREPSSSAWLPCPDRKPNRKWSGVDFLIAAYILLEE